MQKTPNPIDKYVGAQIRIRRRMLGWSQSKLADALGLTFQQIQKYEKGTNRVGSSRLQEISQHLQVPISFFFDGSVAQVPPVECLNEVPQLTSEHIVDFVASSDGQALIKAFERIARKPLFRSVVRLVEEIAETQEWP